MDYTLNKETLFFDYIQDIIDLCLNKNLDDAESNFNKLELIANKSHCSNIVKEAKSLFYTIKEKLRNSEDYDALLKNLNQKLTVAYHNFIDN
jgi:selenophosphate synthetase-related protein